MKTSEFLSILNANRGLPLFFSLGRGRSVPAGYHLTEVKRVAYETMDCGAMTHAWRESHFELWGLPVPEFRPAYMAAGKFLAIVGRVEGKLPLHGDATAKIYYGGKDVLAALYAIEGIAVADGRLEVELTVDRTQCKAAQRKLKQLVASVTPCCRNQEPEDRASADAGCGGAGPEESGQAAGCCEPGESSDSAASTGCCRSETAAATR